MHCLRDALFAALCLVLLLSSPAHALDEADGAAVRGVIGQQIEAFRRDDAAGAYAFAAPGIRRMFPDENVFMDMVRRGYPAVYRPKSFKFGELRQTELGPSQVVDIVDGEGTAWRAVYTLEKQPDGRWKITGCYIVKAPGESA